MLSLQAEAEARQVAQLAWQDGLPQRVDRHRRDPAPQAHPPGVRRGIHAPRRHGPGADSAFTTDPDGLVRIKQAADAAIDTETADMAFLALDLPRARLARPYLGALPLYATSQVYPGNAGPLAAFDLAGVRFLDMPWLLQPDHAAVMALPAARRTATSVELEPLLRARHRRVPHRRWRCSPASPGTPLDGVTGRLTLGPDSMFVRAPHCRPVQRRQADRARAPMNRRGDSAEHLAAAFLERRGLKILERNYRCRFGEIDIVAPQRRDAGVRRGARAPVGSVRRRRRQASPLPSAGALSPPPDTTSPRGRRNAACRFDVVLVRGSRAAGRMADRRVW